MALSYETPRHVAFPRPNHPRPSRLLKTPLWGRLEGMKRKCLILLFLLSGTSVPRAADRITGDERAIGVHETAMIGAWKLRAGYLTDAGKKIFRAECDGQPKFSYATQTVESEWTLGVRLYDGKIIEKKDPASGYIKDRDKAPAEWPVPPVFYLRGPKLLKPRTVVKVEVWSGKKWETKEFHTLPDGVIELGRGQLEGNATALFRFGEKVVSFDTKDLADVMLAVSAFTVEKPKAPEAAKPTPQTLPR